MALSDTAVKALKPIETEKGTPLICAIKLLACTHSSPQSAAAYSSSSPH